MCFCTFLIDLCDFSSMELWGSTNLFEVISTDADFSCVLWTMVNALQWCNPHHSASWARVVLINADKNMFRSKFFNTKVFSIQTSSELKPTKRRNCESKCASSRKEPEKNSITKRLNGNHINKMIIYFGIETENNRLFWSIWSEQRRVSKNSNGMFFIFHFLRLFDWQRLYWFFFHFCLCVCMFARGCYCWCFYFCDWFVWSFKQTSTKCWKYNIPNETHSGFRWSESNSVFNFFLLFVWCCCCSKSIFINLIFDCIFSLHISHFVRGQSFLFHRFDCHYDLKIWLKTARIFCSGFFFWKRNSLFLPLSAFRDWKL